MTYREETYLLNKSKEINKKIDELNDKLDYVVSFINYTISKASEENIDDFGRNILANIISTQFELKQNK